LPENRTPLKELLKSFLDDIEVLDDVVIDDMSLRYSYVGVGDDKINKEIDEEFINRTKNFDVVIVFDEEGESQPYTIMIKVKDEERCSDVMDAVEDFVLMFTDDVKKSLENGRWFYSSCKNNE